VGNKTSSQPLRMSQSTAHNILQNFWDLKVPKLSVMSLSTVTDVTMCGKNHPQVVTYGTSDYCTLWDFCALHKSISAFLSLPYTTTDIMSLSMFGGTVNTSLGRRGSCDTLFQHAAVLLHLCISVQDNTRLIIKINILLRRVRRFENCVWRI
jgi:hypothetical protein